MSTITLTFGDRAESHAGMQCLGALAKSGFTEADLRAAKSRFEACGCSCELVALHNACTDRPVPSAFVLVARNGVAAVLKGNDVTLADVAAEQRALTPDTKAWMRGRVVHKRARHNLCFGDVAQDACFEQRRGTVVAFDAVPALCTLRRSLKTMLGAKAAALLCEGNYYYDVNKCYIGFHGDSERRRVVGVRLGASFPLHYQWYEKRQAIGQPVKIVLNHGDLYVMSTKAVGTDWRRSIVPTLRHAAGFDANVVRPCGKKRPRPRAQPTT